MSSAAVQLDNLAARWRSARRVYAVYAPLVRQSRLGPGCPELDAPVDRPQPEVLERAQQWLDGMDPRIQAAELRRLLQTTQLATEENLQDLIVRYLAREPKDDGLRDKLDFLLVQYFAHCASPALHQGNVSLEDVARVMEPVLGECSTEPPAWLAPLDQALADLHRCGSLRELLDQKVLERGRALKTEAGQMFFGSAALLSFVRFNFLVRRAFFRLLQGDVHGLRHALDQLKARGIETVDCSRAQLSASEPVSRLRELCRNWREPFRAPYSAGQNFRPLVECRAAAEAALVPAAVAAPAAVTAAPEAEPVAVTAAPEPPAPVAAPPEPPAASAPPVPAVPEPAPVSAEPATEPAPKAEHPAEPEAKLAPEHKPAAAPAAAAKPEPSPKQLVLVVEEALDRIAEQLLKSSEKKSVSVTSVEVGGSKLLLSSWEVAAFVEGGDQLSDALQRAVAARAILVEVIAACRKQPGGKAAPGSSEASALAQAIASAETEGAHMQVAVEDAKGANNIDAAVNLAATAKRLQGSAEEAKKLVS